jgi:hypothetical protein
MVPVKMILSLVVCCGPRHVSYGAMMHEAARLSKDFANENQFRDTRADSMEAKSRGCWAQRSWVRRPIVPC